MFKQLDGRKALLGGLILVALLATGFAWQRKTVTLKVDGRNRKVVTFASTVGELLQEQGITLKPHDRVQPERNQHLAEGLLVVVQRAHNVTLTVGTEKARSIITTAPNVQKLLQEQNISPGEKDLVRPDPGTELLDGLKIQVIRVTEKEEKQQVSLPYTTREVPSGEMARGLTATLQRGQNGLVERTWRVIYHNGQEVERQLVNTRVLRQPKPAVVRVGTAQSISRGGRDIRFKYALEMVATAYSYTGYRTASGHSPRYGVVAVDPRVIPLGTRLYVEGYGFATALDKGGAIKGKRIDLFVESHRQASRWGVRRVKVYVL
ncbi:MAG: ubiquitin-like domain-containing protein [Bacillota bacterium]|uniref:ubiquitin-like domain-containing protein n=1 Tax=Desulfurispora thermophila TaxID=265470 RepID=UPI0003796049|nr:ubiquitin-like domain-containing protein [Desulfurispora thermophila]